MTPYEILGVPKDATPEAIRAAYLKKAKELHPDAGGDPEAFAAMQEAYETLSDPDSRAFYDATGQTSAQGSQLDKQAVGLLSQIMLSIVADRSLDLVNTDVVELIGKQVAELIKNIEEVIQNNGKHVERLEAFRERLKVKEGAANPLAATIAAAITDAGRMTAGARQELRLRMRAKEILEGYGYDFVRAIPAPRSYNEFQNAKLIKPNVGSFRPWFFET